MPLRRSVLVRWLPERACPFLAGLLILAAAAGHLAFLGSDCPLDLASDEAHYWDWSRHLDWSYYSKGPLVAWLIRGSCELFGALAEEHTGNLMLAIRLPAVLCGSLLLASLYVLAVQVFHRPRLGLAVVFGALTFPPIAVGSSLMTIDAPYACCWGWALVFAHRAVMGRRSSLAWEAAGLMIGLGILAKYTMIVFVPSLALFLLTSRAHRRLLLSSGFWSMLGVAGLCTLPILVWNAQHDWVSLRHVLRLAGLDAGEGPALRSGPGISPLGPLTYIGIQAALLLGYWFVVWLCAVAAWNPLRESDAGVRYLWWLSVPMFVLFLAFSIKTGGGEPNWPITAYLSGAVLAAGWLANQLESSSSLYRRCTRAGIALTCLIGLLVTGVIHSSEHIHPLLGDLVGPETDSRPYPIRQLDPTCRLRGWRTLAAALDRQRARLVEAGEEEPVLAAVSWSLPGEIGVYCAGGPQAYSLGLMQGDRHSQYDYWTNPIDQPQEFLGRTFLVVGVPQPPVVRAFERIDRAIRVTHRVNGRPVAGWHIFVCRGFKGFAEKPTPAGH
jgi:4-amino-4-deoxy-L-arabinose transferase-like glycosyltransferase